MITTNQVTLSDGNELTGASSDKEYGAGQAIHHELENKGLNNVVVFVRRSCGASNLGPKRFQIIENCATEAVNKNIKKVVYDTSDHQAAEDVGHFTPITH